MTLGVVWYLVLPLVLKLSVKVLILAFRKELRRITTVTTSIMALGVVWYLVMRLYPILLTMMLTLELSMIALSAMIGGVVWCLDMSPSCMIEMNSKGRGFTTVEVKSY